MSKESERAKTMVLEEAIRGSDYVRVAEKGRNGRSSDTFSASLSHKFIDIGCREPGVWFLVGRLVLIVDLLRFERVLWPI